MKAPVLVISAFGSANARLVSIPNTLFNTSIDNNVLVLSFKTDVAIGAGNFDMTRENDTNTTRKNK